MAKIELDDNGSAKRKIHFLIEPKKTAEMYDALDTLLEMDIPCGFSDHQRWLVLVPKAGTFVLEGNRVLDVKPAGVGGSMMYELQGSQLRRTSVY